MKRTCMCCLIVFIGALALPSASFSQDSLISPNPLDFGLVEWGSSRMLPLTVESVDNLQLIVTDIGLTDDAGGVFTILDIICSDPVFQYPDAFDIPSVLLEGETLRVEVLYAPVSLGTHAGWLRVESNDHDEPDVYIPLTGRSAPAVPAPSALLLLGSGLLTLCGRRSVRIA